MNPAIWVERFRELITAETGVDLDLAWRIAELLIEHIRHARSPDEGDVAAQ